MLALAYAAEHPEAPNGLVLVGCGTFSKRAREEFATRLNAKLKPADRTRIHSLELSEPDADRRFAALGRLMSHAYSYDAEESCTGPDTIDAKAHEQTWQDMLRLQREGKYPAAFAEIRSPVLMLHGADDPHPGDLILEDLREYIPHIRYHLLPKCGHSPWMERQARQEFFEVLEAWISER